MTAQPGPTAQAAQPGPTAQAAQPAPTAQTAQAATTAQPHVVMLVANDVTADTRVRKSALAVAALGARVTVVGVSRGPRREVSRLGEVTILRVPVDFVLRDRRKSRRAAWHRGDFGAVSTGYRSEALDRWRLALAERDAATREGVGGEVARGLARARRFAVRAEGYGRRRAATAARLAYKVVDKGVQSTGVGAAPRRVVPEVDDLELAVGPVLDELAPDVIHAHDVHFLAVAGRAVARARLGAGGRPGRTVPWIYDAHEWVPGLSRYGGRTARVVAAWAALEKRWAPRADRVITVSPPLAAALRERHHLGRLPEVVLNVPPLGEHAEGESSVRRAAGVPDAVPLLVYSGGVQAARGVTTAVEALRELPGMHLAVVAVNHDAPAVEDVRRAAAAAGVATRVHVLPGVRPDRVVAFLASADVGLVPLLHFGSHEVALANKLFEYLHAGLPMVVSDCRAQTDFVREHGLGAVHTAGDAADLARAVREVLAHREEIAPRLADPALRARYTWQGQAEVLQGVYRDLVPGRFAAQALPVGVAEPEEVPVRDAGVVLVTGPANSAGQGWAWAQAAARHLAGVSGWTIAIRNEKYDYPADELVDRRTYSADAAWQLGALARARSTWTHVLLEAGRPLLGGLAGRDFVADADLLRRSGVQVALAFHGSEVRDPRRHAATHPYSPFTDPGEDLTKRLQARVDALLPQVEAFDGELFASTPDQLAYLPDRARWLPVVVDVDAFTSLRDPDDARRVPLVVHAPSNPALKGTAHVERVLGPWHERGLIDLRMITGMPPAEAAALVRRADVVLDQFVLGLYGVLACEGMASGALVLGHLGESLRARVIEAVGEDVPVVETTPDTLAETMQRVLDDPAWASKSASAGTGFVRRVHDGRRSATVLAPFLTAPS